MWGPFWRLRPPAQCQVSRRELARDQSDGSVPLWRYRPSLSGPLRPQLGPNPPQGCLFVYLTGTCIARNASPACQLIRSAFGFSLLMDGNPFPFSSAYLAEQPLQVPG